MSEMIAGNANRPLTFLATVLCIAAVLLSGCSKDEGRVAVKRMAHPKKAVPQSSAYLQEYARRLEALLAPVNYSYDPAGKPDPFRPFLRRELRPVARVKQAPRKKASKKRPTICKTPLECMDVGQLTLVAIIDKGNGERIAMAQDAAGAGYFIEKGTRIGFQGGEVVAILPDRVIIEEKGEDIMGRPVVNKRVMVLHPEEE